MLPVSGAEQLKTSGAIGERRVREMGGAGAPIAFGEEEVPEAALARLGLQFLHDRRHLPARRARFELVVEDLLVREDVLVHEVVQLLHVHPGLLRVLEFHVGLPAPVGFARPPRRPNPRTPGGRLSTGPAAAAGWTWSARRDRQMRDLRDIPCRPCSRSPRRLPRW